MVPSEVYKQGVKLSRKFKNRDITETKFLYGLLQEAATLAQLDDKKENNKEKQKALDFLVEVFNPFIIKTASRIYHKVSSYVEYEDVLQDTYCIFLKLIKGYEEEKATFAYYINQMLNKQMYAWSMKHYTSKSTPVDNSILEESIKSSRFKTPNQIYDDFDELILRKEYEEFIVKRSFKSSKTNTTKEVCDNYFLGSETCSDIADRLGISYHAVYGVIDKVKKELEYFFHHSSFTEFRLINSNVVGIKNSKKKGK